MGEDEAKLLARAATLLEGDASRQAALAEDELSDEWMAPRKDDLVPNQSAVAAALVSSVPGVSARRLGGSASAAKRPVWQVVSTSCEGGGKGGKADHPSVQIDAIDSAMLATAFAAACAPGEQTITLDALPATLRRAGVPGVDALARDAVASDLTGHVALHFAEVIQIAQKLRAYASGVSSGAKAATPAGLLSAPAPGPGSALLMAPAAAAIKKAGTLPDATPSPPLPEELRAKLARAFALEADTVDSALPASALRRTLSAGGIDLPAGALPALLGVIRF